MSTRRVYGQKKLRIDSEETSFKVNDLDTFKVNGLKILHEGSGGGGGSSASYGSMDFINQGNYVPNTNAQYLLQWQNVIGSSLALENLTDFSVQPGIYTFIIVIKYSPSFSPSAGHIALNDVGPFDVEIKQNILAKPTAGGVNIQSYSFQVNVDAFRSGCNIHVQLFSNDPSVLIQSCTLSYIKHA